MSRVTLIIPKDRSILEDKFAKALAEAVSSMLTDAEREHLVAEIERRENKGIL